MLTDVEVLEVELEVELVELEVEDVEVVVPDTVVLVELEVEEVDVEVLLDVEVEVVSPAKYWPNIGQPKGFRPKLIVPPSCKRSP